MSWRSSVKTGGAIAAVTLAIEAIAVLPGRIALGNAQAQLGRSPTEFAIAGACRDLSDLALPIGAVGVAVLGTVMMVRRSKSEIVLRHTSRRAMTGLLAVTSVIVYFISSIAAEFKIERGVDATWFDLQLTKNWGNPLDTIMGFMFLRRHFLPGIVAVTVAAALLFSFYRRAKTWPMQKRLPALLSFGATSVLGYALALVPLDPHVRVFRTITDRHVVGEPFLNLFAGFGHSQENVHLGMKVLIERAKYSPEQSRGGEALLGLPTRAEGASLPKPGASADCTTHPMARALPENGVEATLPGMTGSHPLDADAQEALALLDQISAELFDKRSTPIDVWQVMLESFRADDVHATSPAAPRELTPFMNALYEAAAGPAKGTKDNGDKGDKSPPKSPIGRGSAIAIKNLWQSGSRTSQGLSSYMCGLGMMPYGLSVTRDFGPIPMRCLPDLLVDADLTGTFFYGGPPSFDEMDTFLRNHGIREIIGQLQQPISSPTSEVGVSDRAIMAHAAELVNGSPPAAHGRYVLIMSGSNHAPYRRPDDLPTEIETRVKSLIESTPGFGGTSDDVARLRTFAYTDLAISELYTQLEKNLDRSIFVFGGDHATSDPFVWPPTSDWTLDGAHAKIPYAILFPEALIEKSSHPDVLRDLITRLNAVLDRQQWAQNDTPLMLLTLMSHAPGMQLLPPEARWHTLGGARTSPFFVPPQDDVKIVGIDCVSELFGTDEQGRSILPRETASFVKTEDEIYTVSPTLIPIAATFSRFLNGYASACRDSRVNKHASR